MMKREEEIVRLNKYLARAGVCSRRDADRLIEQGRVLVNGCRPDPGQSVSGGDVVTVDGKRVKAQERTVVLAFYKPVGVTCTQRDVHAEKLISDFVRYPVRVTYAGRLDKDAEGLLLLTNDGDLIQEMMRGANGHEKEYIVRVDKEITADFLSDMAAGVYLEELDITTRKCRVEKTGRFTFKIILTQGVNRQIRRMCEACGRRVRSIRRIRVMNITLGNLKPGEYVELRGQELEQLYREAGFSGVPGTG